MVADQGRHPTMNPLFSVLFGVLVVALVVVEVVGVVRKQRGDTLTENWRWLDRHLPAGLRWFLRVFTAGMLLWTALHFGGRW
jgi:hypothetical protein